MCPRCGARETARVWWTPWGGILGPLLFQLVRCRLCSQRFTARRHVPEHKVVRTYCCFMAPVVLLAGLGLLLGLTALGVW
jgi:hypothetical protein